MFGLSPESWCKMKCIMKFSGVMPEDLAEFHRCLDGAAFISVDRYRVPNIADQEGKPISREFRWVRLLDARLEKGSDSYTVTLSVDLKPRCTSEDGRKNGLLIPPGDLLFRVARALGSEARELLDPERLISE